MDEIFNSGSGKVYEHYMCRNIKIFYNKEVKLINFKNVSLKKKRKQILSMSFETFSFIMKFFQLIVVLI